MTNFWLNDPQILLNKDNITEIWPKSDMDSITKLNAMTRLVFILTILGFIISKTIKVVITGVITLIAIIILYYYQNYTDNKKVNKEGFMNPDIYNESKDKFQQPTSNNPLMNLTQSDISNKVNRKPGAPAFIPEVRDKINETTKKMIISNFDNNSDIEKKLFKNLGDSYDFEHSMRNWYVTPNTLNPNDQEGFANFCYGNMKSCKENNTVLCG